MNYERKLMIGGQALLALGHDRTTDDTDYLINDDSTRELFLHDKEANIDYINANGLVFFSSIWDYEQTNIGPLASPRAIFELKCFSFVQHCLNGSWKKVASDEYDIKFLCRNYGFNSFLFVDKHISRGQLSELLNLIHSVRR